MTVMNQSSVSPLSVTVSVPRSCNDSVVLRDTNTRYSWTTDRKMIWINNTLIIEYLLGRVWRNSGFTE